MTIFYFQMIVCPTNSTFIKLLNCVCYQQILQCILKLIFFIPQFSVDQYGQPVQDGTVRGLGTDVAIVSSMVFLAQFMLSCCLGTIVSWSGTTTAVVCVASTLAACGAVSATQIMYLDL